ncbi:MAG: DUF4422 domain-containing protein [Rickettsiales bacterium]|jgi:hypothetical protein|nr:DUF4422 domain-containing protein [Rickettsiales bacterium]
MNKILLNLCSIFIIKKKKREYFKIRYKNKTLLSCFCPKKISNMIDKINRIDNIDTNNRYNRINIQTNRDYSIEGWKYDNPLDKTKYDIKIIITYHRPAFLFQHKVLLPIHGGRDIKDNNIIKSGAGEFIKSEQSIKWLQDNMIGDNTGDNISYMNKNISIESSLYWVWKHYDEIGNPAYIGNFHFRKLFPFSALHDYAIYDLILPIKRQTGKGCDLLNEINEITMNIIKKHSPELVEEIRKWYLKEAKDIYYDEMYIMTKKLFFEYCEWIFPIIFDLYEVTTKQKIQICSWDIKGDVRQVAWVVERLTGWWLWKKTQDKNIKYKEMPIVIIE